MKNVQPSGTDLIWMRVKQLAMGYSKRRRTPSRGSIERDVRRAIGEATGESGGLEREVLAFYCREAHDLAERYRADQRISASAGR
jgi:hypothetical protein